MKTTITLESTVFAGLSAYLAVTERSASDVLKSALRYLPAVVEYHQALEVDSGGSITVRVDDREWKQIVRAASRELPASGICSALISEYVFAAMPGALRAKGMQSAIEPRKMHRLSDHPLDVEVLVPSATVPLNRLHDQLIFAVKADLVDEYEAFGIDVLGSVTKSVGFRGLPARVVEKCGRWNLRGGLVDEWTRRLRLLRERGDWAEEDRYSSRYDLMKKGGQMTARARWG